MASMTRDMRYRLSLIYYGERYGVSNAARKAALLSGSYFTFSSIVFCIFSCTNAAISVVFMFLYSS